MRREGTRQPARQAPEKSRSAAGGGGLDGESLTLDVEPETARALHRIVRAMHDGECPRCHALHTSDQMPVPNPDPGEAGWDLECPSCQFRVSAAEIRAALAAFGPVMRRCLAVFEDWRRGR